MSRTVGIGLLTVGLSVQSAPLAWAQLTDVDPALAAAVEALVTRDPEVASDPELAQLCREIAESTIQDPRERAAVTREVIAIRREGLDVNTMIPTEVREAAREQFSQMQGQMREQLDTLRTTDPERAREMEFMMREGERQMLAFESGERYTPSAEMTAHAETMFREWESEMASSGAPPEMVERARMEFARWSSGEMEMGGMMGGPGHEMMGPGGPMPSPEQMEAMVSAGQMTPEQLQMAKDYMANPEAFTSTHPGYETFGPTMGGDTPFEGPGPSGGYMPEGWARDQSGSLHYVDTGFEAQGFEYQGSPMEVFNELAGHENTYSPEQYQREIEQYRPENQTYDNLQQQQFDQTQPPPAETFLRNDVHIADHNSDGDILDAVDTHPHEIYRHTQGTGDLTDDTCHDHSTQGAVSC